MAISRGQKDEIVARYVELLNSSNGFAVVQTQGVKVNRVEQLRKAVREAGGSYVVGKNTMVIQALRQAGWSVPEGMLQGPTGIAFGGDNFPGVAKAVIRFIDDNDIDPLRMAITGGVMGTDVVDAAGVEAISNLPTLPELQAQIIGLLVQPSRQIVTILHSAESGVVNVLQAWLDKDASASGEDEAA